VEEKKKDIKEAKNDKFIGKDLNQVYFSINSEGLPSPLNKIE